LYNNVAVVVVAAAAAVVDNIIVGIFFIEKEQTQQQCQCCLGDDFIFSLSLLLVLLYCYISVISFNVIAMYCSCPTIKMIITTTSLLLFRFEFMAVGEQNSLGCGKNLPECSKQKYFQMYSVFSKKRKSSLKFFLLKMNWKVKGSWFYRKV